MPFNIKDCYPPQVYCGKKKKVPKRGPNGQNYVRRGTPYECLKQGIGAGTHQERDKYLPKNSLQHIRYIGPVHENNFKDIGIDSIPQLKRWMEDRSGKAICRDLKNILVKNNGDTDFRAYNSVILYSYQILGITHVPRCKKIK